jgi:phage nucleotide-binding protein
MPLPITKGSDIIKVDHVKIMIYGQPGTGKTSAAFTSSPNVLLLDCDNGAYRSNYRKDAVQVNSWDDIANITADDLKDYDTVVVDTVGRLLDFLTSSLIEHDPKLGYRGALTLQGYGQLKTQFREWTKHLSTLGKDLIMVAHDREDKKGDQSVVRPDIQGGSYSEVFKIADAVGYLYTGDKPREPELTSNVLDFNPTPMWEGKNVAKLDPIKVPNFNFQPDFLAGVIADIKEAINELSKEGKMIADVVSTHKKRIDKVKTVQALNTELDKYKGSIPDAQSAIKRILFNKSKGLGFAYDADKGVFTSAEKPAADDAGEDVQGVPEND